MSVLINDSTSAAIFPLSRQKPSQPRSRRQLRRPSYAKMNARVGETQARQYSLVKLLVLHIDARDAFADRAQNFVRNRPQLSRDFVSGDTAVLRAPDQNDLVADFDAGNIGHVQKRKIHADLAHDASVVVVDDGPTAVGKRPAKAVRVTHRN